MYNEFAAVYDRLMDDVDYTAWAAHYAELLRMFGVMPGKKVVECACGTGSLTIPLQRMGYKMTGIDLSEEMLAAAMEKARAAGQLIPFICQDMTQLSLPTRAHAVLATCDGVNYLTAPDKVQAFFRASYAALRPGGVLCFDVSTPEKLSGTLGSHTLFADEEDYAYIWQNSWDEASRCVSLDLTIFVKRPDGAFDRVEESQTQRAHSQEELRLWLEEAGFSRIAFYGAQRMDTPSPGDDRWHVIAIKNS